MFSLKPMVKNTYGKTGKNRTEIIKRRIEQAFAEHPGVTNKEVSEHCDVSEQAVWKWRRHGKIQRDHVPLLASFFDQRPDWLLDDLNEVREPSSTYIIEPTQTELDIIHAMRDMPPELTTEIERHILAISKACTKKQR